MISNKKASFEHITGKIRNFSFIILSFSIALIVWQMSITFHIVEERLLPSPAMVWITFLDYLLNRRLLLHIWASFQRVAIGFSIGLLCAILIGFLIGWYSLVRRLLDPLINFFRALPPIALIPLMIVYFGIGEVAKIIVLFYAAFFSAVVVIYQSIVTTNPVLIWAARSLGATDKELFFTVILRNLVPHIFTAARVAMGVSWATLVASELIAAQAGIGAMITEAANFFQLSPIILGIILIGLISITMDSFIRFLESKLTVWQERI